MLGLFTTLHGFFCGVLCLSSLNTGENCANVYSSKTCLCCGGTCNSLPLANFVELYGIKCWFYKWLFFWKLGIYLFAHGVPLILMESHSCVLGISQAQNCTERAASHTALSSMNTWWILRCGWQPFA